jgi:hypothetical protein
MDMQQEQVNDVFNLHQQVLGNEKARRALLLENMKYVITIHDSKGYKAILGDEQAEWSAYLSDVGVFYSRARVRRWKRIFQFCDRFSLDTNIVFTIPESRLEHIALLPIESIESKEKAEELLSFADNMLPRDWKNEILKMRGKPSIDDCSHEFKLYEVCPHCGDKHVKQI